MKRLIKLFGKVTAHTLCWRMRVGIFGMLCFQDLQRYHHPVKFTVGYNRLRENVIIIIMPFQFPSQLFDPDFCVFHR
ncbi:hypothetical protein Barb7_00647 [Bacteroidales bacterium Barb7]|nr:hypothetical protein Barb7_00647 [Bacteroidales bacterium Barb7]